jgi:putative transposase
MPRANRYFHSGHVWHITHRCHQKEFFLKFAKDRKRWVEWHYEAKKRFGLSVLNYVVTSNHIHLKSAGSDPINSLILLKSSCKSGLKKGLEVCF